MTSKIDKNALVFSAQLQLKKYGSFLSDYNHSLDTLLGQIADPVDLIENVNSITIKNDDELEATSVFQIIETDNKILSKILLTFSALYDSVKEIKKESEKLILNFVLMDEGLAEIDTQCQDKAKLKNECLSHIHFGDVLELLNKIRHFLDHIIKTICNTIGQLEALYQIEKEYINMSKSIHFQSVFHFIADLNVILITFQQLIKNASITSFWQFFKQSIRSVKYNLDTFDQKFDRASVEGVESVLIELELLLTGDVFDQLLHSITVVKLKSNAKSLGVFSGHLFSYLKTTLAKIVKYDTDLADNFEPHALIKVTAMAVIYHHLFGNLDKKIFRLVVETNIKHCVVTLIGNILWIPEIFLIKHAESLAKPPERLITEFEKSRQNYLDQRISNLTKHTKQLIMQVSLWAIEFKETLNVVERKINNEETKKLCDVLYQGLHLAAQIGNTIKTTTNLHATLTVRMSKPTLLSITKLLELLQIVQSTFQRYANKIVKSMHYITQNILYKILVLVSATKKKYTESTINDKHIDTIASLNICEKILHGPPTQKRIYIARLALGASDPSKSFDTEALNTLEKNLKQIDSILSIFEKIQELSTPTFLYWHSSIIPLHFKIINESNMNLEQLKYLTASINECYNKFLENKLIISSTSSLETFKNESTIGLTTEIIQKICHEIETFLRLDYHSNLQLEKYNPFHSHKVYYTMKALAQLQPMILFGKKVLMKDHIEQYINCTYYNLTTISLHDWKTYGEMRKLLNFKFGLNTGEDYLPTQTLEQGLDVLQIMRNINVFVSKYLYNLNNQIFIEQISTSKYLNTINITHIANSLRAHGSGIVNTTVNFTYQFLRNKFQIFSQFMFDEQIKSRLLKEAKYVKDTKENSTDNKTYPYERADNLNRNIKKLGLSPQGMSYMDMFRTLISHIGNAMGYVRMVRSGAQHFTADASVYLPDLDENLKFVFLVKENELSMGTLNAAEDLETNIENMSKTFAEGTEYFKLLVETFAPFFRNTKHIHLKNFYLIVPALTINFVECMLTSKDKLNKKDKSGALFTDDGFAIGLAYILKLLDQIGDFNSLHWFKTLRHKYVRELKELNDRRSSDVQNGDEKLQQTFALTEKRITAFQQEFDLLYYNLSSAKIFFQ